MPERIKVSEIMSERPVVIDTDETVQKAVLLMRENNISGLIVVKEKYAVAIITIKDIAMKTIAENLLPTKVKVKDVMNEDIIEVEKDITVQKLVDEYFMKYYAGIDIGAATTKAVIIDGSKKLVAHHVRKSGVDLEGSAEQALAEALKSAKLKRDDVVAVIGTGYGRNNVPLAKDTLTEIASHSKGCYHYFPHQITIIDIGGQDNKIIRVGGEGKRKGFKMNRKCAAGTGAFLEELALRLDVPLDEMNGLALKATGEVTLGSFCTVFTSTEILAKIRSGANVEDIVKGIYRSIIKRVMEMELLEGEIVMTGGVVEHNPIIVDMMSEEMGSKVLVPPHPQITGAFGAALFASEK